MGEKHRALKCIFILFHFVSVKAAQSLLLQLDSYQFMHRFIQGDPPPPPFFTNHGRKIINLFLCYYESDFICVIGVFGIDIETSRYNVLYHRYFFVILAVRINQPFPVYLPIKKLHSSLHFLPKSFGKLHLDIQLQFQLHFINR